MVNRNSTTIYLMVEHDAPTPTTGRLESVTCEYVAFLNKRDAQEAVNRATLEQIKNFKFDSYYYDSSEVIPVGFTAASFVAFLNKHFPDHYRFTTTELLANIDQALDQMSDEHKLELLRLLKFSFVKVIEVALNA
jgi:hypothetical protein